MYSTSVVQINIGSMLKDSLGFLRIVVKFLLCIDCCHKISVFSNPQDLFFQNACNVDLRKACTLKSISYYLIEINWAMSIQPM